MPGFLPSGEFDTFASHYYYLKFLGLHVLCPLVVNLGLPLDLLSADLDHFIHVVCPPLSLPLVMGVIEGVAVLLLPLS